MSYAVLHMDKYKKDAISGIQSHNQRERKSHSNPDIDYARSKLNYDLHNAHPVNFLEKAQSRIDEMRFKNAVRKDAVYMCGIIISSDQEFFNNKSDDEIRGFFHESYRFLAKYVGKENIIAATVHMDEKTPHMHFMHVPITKGKRLSVKTIYTPESLQKLQTDFVIHIQNHGQWIERGVKKGQGSVKKHLNTPEFKQQMEALNLVKQEIADKTTELENLHSDTKSANAEKDTMLAEREHIEQELEEYVQIAFEAKTAKTYEAKLPKPGLANARKIYYEAQEIISSQKKLVAVQKLIMRENEDLKKENKNLAASYHKIRNDMKNQAQSHTEDIQEFNRDLRAAINVQELYKNIVADFEILNDFLKQPHIKPQYLAYEASRKPKPVKSKEEQANEIAVPKPQAREPQKRSSGFER